jgi:hypothetical protein
MKFRFKTAVIERRPHDGLIVFALIKGERVMVIECELSAGRALHRSLGSLLESATNGNPDNGVQ